MAKELGAINARFLINTTNGFSTGERAKRGRRPSEAKGPMIGDTSAVAPGKSASTRGDATILGGGGRVEPSEGAGASRTAA